MTTKPQPINVFQLIKEEELSEDLQLLSETCGMDVMRILLEKCTGWSFYIPKISRFEGFIRRYITENMHKSTKVIASELGVSDQFLKNLKRDMGRE